MSNNVYLPTRDGRLKPTTDGWELTSMQGGGIQLNDWPQRCNRYLTFVLQPQTDDSVAMNLLLFTDDSDKPAMTIRFGVLPRVRTTVAIDREWLKNEELYPVGTLGSLKYVCHGHRIDPQKVTLAVLAPLPVDRPITLGIYSLSTSNVIPQVEIDEIKLVDYFGQNKRKNWPTKISSESMLRERLLQQYTADKHRPDDWDDYGGSLQNKVDDGTGFFRTQKQNNRWYLVDPTGHLFFSLGMDCVGIPADGRVKGLEKWFDWLPDDTSEYYRSIGDQQLISFPKINLERVFGDDWLDSWCSMILNQLGNTGVNTIGNWSDPLIKQAHALPYVSMLPEFPDTHHHIFRDFPDVFSSEFEQSACLSAEGLKKDRDDPWMIGYFLRNEPSWAFVDGLNLGIEVLRDSVLSATKVKLIEELRMQYLSIEALNESWGSSFVDFTEIEHPIIDFTNYTEQAQKDLRHFSSKMIACYAKVPAEACRNVDPNHLILGMRWAWLSDPDIVSGWQAFDVFSINCYAEDPTNAINQVTKYGVDLPVMIGEFHHGATDRGPTATGLEGVENQEMRGQAFRHYAEAVATNPMGIGCHYFQCYDQFILGRPDGENYNIGLFDICNQIYPELARSIRACSEELITIHTGELASHTLSAKSRPMIAY